MKMGTKIKAVTGAVAIFLMSNTFAATNDMPVSNANPGENTTELTKSKHPLADTEITAKVKEKFIQEKLLDKKNVPAISIHVKTVDGVVFLRGKVNSPEQETNAINIAKSVKGVVDVKSRVKIVNENKR